MIKKIFYRFKLVGLIYFVTVFLKNYINISFHLVYTFEYTKYLKPLILYYENYIYCKLLLK